VPATVTVATLQFIGRWNNITMVVTLISDMKKTTLPVILRGLLVEQQAGQFASQHKYADALALLAKAQEDYLSVNDEFPAEFQAATTGLANVGAKISELKDGFIKNAQTLSGATFEYEMQRMAAQAAPDLDEKALKKIGEAQLKTALEKLNQQYETKFRIR